MKFYPSKLLWDKYYNGVLVSVSLNGLMNIVTEFDFGIGLIKADCPLCEIEQKLRVEFGR